MTTAFDDHERRMWAGSATAYAESFALLCAYPAEALLDAAAVTTGVTVLDAGTGIGTVAARAAARGATVTAVDAEPTMAEFARARVPSADVRVAVLPEMPFPDDAFDAVVANFVLNHVGDPAAAARELARVVRPGGRVAVTIWPSPSPPAQAIWGSIFAEAGVDTTVPMPRLAPGDDFARTTEGLTGLLVAAGLVETGGDVLGWQHRVTVEQAWNGPANGLGTPGTLLARQDPATVRRVRAAFDRVTAGHRDADGLLSLPTSALLAYGVRPAGPVRPAS
jgi:SAM-dependent methyltransferase